MQSKKVSSFWIRKMQPIPKIFNNSDNLIARKPNNSIKKWMKDLNRHFSNLPVARRYMKKKSSLITRKCKFNTMRLHLKSDG
jgi:hypothetical protein